MPDIHRIAPAFAVAGQLRPDDLAAIAAEGFRTIVNNRPDGEAPDQPTSDALEAEARRLGLDYAYIPVVPGQIGPEHAQALGRFLRDAARPVLAFCRTGNRSASLWKLAHPEA